MIRAILRLTVILGGLAFLLLAVFIYYFGQDFTLGRSLSREALSYPIIITDRNGQELHRLFGDENREWVELKDISSAMQEATITAEDRRFYQHFGIDLRGIARAVWRNAQAGEYREGASTLTQQIARKVYLTDEKTIRRKLREMAVAFGIESKFSKAEILEMYLNTVPYGPRINGVKLAAETYFHKSPAQLNAEEAQILAQLPKDPVRSVERLDLQGKKTWTDDDFQHWRFFVLDFLADKGFHLSDYQKGAIIRTTLDRDLQREMYSFLRDKVSGKLYAEWGIENLALLILDHEQRGPLVWIGSKYFWNKDIQGQVDMLRSRRQIGSAIKPFLYALMIGEGYGLPTLLSDTPITLSETSHQVSNFDGRYYGRLTMGEALVWSRNIPAIKALYLAGGEKNVRQSLDQIFHFDIDQTYPHHRFGWALSLGAIPLRLMDVGNAYATLATNQYQEICPILEVTDIEGNPFPSPCDEEALAQLEGLGGPFINAALSDTKKRPWRWSGVITPPNYPEIAVKTGTASKRQNKQLLPTDNVVAGYSPRSTILFWAGNTDGRALRDGSLAVNSIGSVWRDLVGKFFDRYPDRYATFTFPEAIKDELVKVRGEWALQSYIDQPYSDLYHQSLVDRGAWLNDPDYIAPPSLVEGEEFEEPSPLAQGPQRIDRNLIEQQEKEALVDLEAIKNRILKKRKERGW